MRTAYVLAASLSLLAAGCGRAPAGSETASIAAADSLTSGAKLASNAPLNCTIKTVNGHYLTAVGAGGRTSDVLHTDAVRVGSWEKFKLIDSGDGNANIHYGIQTYNGHYLTAVGGGGRNTDVIHSNATQLQAWEKFTFNSLGGGWYAIQTINGHYLTAVGGGGLITDTIHSDATKVSTWEKFFLTCTH